jgi:hypothetical protein
MQFRCPRTRHCMTVEMCKGRKLRRTYGCVTCTYPNKVLRDQKRLEKISVRLATDGGKGNNRVVVISGLASRSISLSPRVAEGVARMILEAVGNM